MYKVTINSDGKIIRISDDTEIGVIEGFKYSDFSRYPNILKPSKIKLYNTEKKVTLSYGGLVNGNFEEACHIKCVWGSNCLRFKKGNCKYNPEMKDVGFYIS